MNKALFAVVSIVLATSPLYSQTDSKTSDFLNKVNHYYYCLQREGLGSFKCSVTLDLPDLMNQVRSKEGKEPFHPGQVPEGLYNVVYQTNGQLEVTGDSPKKTGDKVLDKALLKNLKTAAEALGVYMRFFNSFNIHPVFLPDDLVRNSYRISTKDYGFDAQAAGTYIAFDKQVKVLHIGENAQDLAPVQFEFRTTPKGWLLAGLSTPIKAQQAHFQMQDEATGGFQFPKSLTLTYQSKDKIMDGLTLHFVFSDYQINH